MQHAIMIMAHKNMEQLCHLVEYFTHDCYVFIHLDRKFKVSKEEKERLEAFPQVVKVYQKLVHSHPDSNTGADDADKYAAYLYEKEGYTFFGIVNPYSLVPNDFKPMSYGEAIRYNLEAIQS